ncbi:MAG: hypothetical protein IKC89_06280 [Lentisphaeria bacterium]|nr:hypothetical protein [Lentisphaeria bacterium]
MKNLLLLFFLLSIFQLRAELIPLFDKPATDAKLMIAERTSLVDTGKRHRLMIPEHPVTYIHEFSELTTPDGKQHLFYRNDLVLNRAGNGIERLPEVPVLRLISAALAALLLAGFVYKFVRKELPENFLVFIPVLLRMALVLVVLCKWDCVVTAATDETGYFAVMHDMLNGVWNRPWRFTIGTGIFYLPFMLAVNADNVWDIMPYFNYFSALVLAPGTLAIGFFIMRKLGVSGKRACLTMLIWAVYPFVAFHFEEWGTLDFQQFFLFPYLFTTFHRLVFYAFCINSGFNAMSDIPGLLTLLGGVLLALAIPPKHRYALLVGALYGFACLIRINYILWAPVFALVLYHKFDRDRRTLATAAATAAGGFLAIFSIQLVCNALQFGSPFTFGYILHYPEYAPLDRPAAGFTWHTFKKLTFTRYLLAANLPVFAAGAAALWCIKERFKQQILVLMSVPVILFFCGYSHTFCDARRFVFPAFAGLLMACGCGAPDVENKWQRSRIFIGIALMLLLTVPFNAHWKGAPFMLGDGLFLRLTQAAVPIYITALIFECLKKKQLRTGTFIFLCALFFYAPYQVLGSGLLLLLPWTALRQWLPEKVKSRFKSKLEQLLQNAND